MEFSTATHRPLQANHFSLKKQHHSLFQRDLLGGRVASKSNRLSAKVQRKSGECQDSLFQTHLYRGKRRGSNDSTEERRIPLSNKRLLTDCNNLTQVDNKRGAKNVNQSNTNKSPYGKFTKFSIEEICRGNRYTSDSSTLHIDNDTTIPKPPCEIKTLVSQGSRDVAPIDSNEIITSLGTGKEKLKEQVFKESSPLSSTLDILNDIGSDSSTELRDYDTMSNCQENHSSDSVTNSGKRLREPSVSELDEKSILDNGCKGPLKRKRRVDQEERRRIANERERSRVHTLAAAFDALREAIPSFSPSQKLSKLTILKVAINYISALDSLNSGMPTILSKDHFSDSVDACTHALKAEYGRAKRISWHDKK